MATTSDVKLQIAGIGHVYRAPVGTKPFSLANYKFNGGAAQGGWSWIGDTSSENMIEFEVDGGDITQKRTWDRLNVRAIREPESISATVNKVNASAKDIQFGFPGGTYDAATGSYTVKSGAGSDEGALFVVVEDGDLVGGMYLPNTDTKGSFPTFSIEEFTEFPLSVAVLSDPELGDLWTWFEPRPRSGISTP